MIYAFPIGLGRVCKGKPDLVAPLLTSPHQAIWLFPTGQFKSRSFRERGKDRYSAREKNSDPALATSNFYARDLILAGMIRQDVVSQGLSVLDIHSTMSKAAVVDMVVRHFATYRPLQENLEETS